jgi:hypothetical protein
MAALIQQELSGEKISHILNSEGPIVSCVFVPADTGIAEEIKLDMTPKLATPGKQLGGSPTFAGTITSLDVIIMALREPASGTAANSHILPAPMDSANIPGPILRIRMDENSEQQDFTLEEYKTYKANPVVEVESSSTSSSSASDVTAKADEEDEGDEEDENDENDENDEDDEDAASDDDDDEGDYMEHVIKRIAEVFKQQTGRDPTPEEVQALLANMSGEPDEDEDDEDSDDDDDNEEKEEEEEEEVGEEVLENMTPDEMAKLLRGKLAEAFQQSQGRAPTEDEIDQLLEGLSQDTDLQDDMLRAGEQAAQTPAPAENKKRKLEEGAEENANKKTSPASVTDPAATQ